MSLNLSLKTDVKGVLDRYKLSPSKKLGQNFLVDLSAVGKFLKSADFNLKDTVLEVGPGIGNLTQEIAKRVKRVIAVEKDPKLAEILKDGLRMRNVKNVKVIEGDILNLESETLNLKSYKAVGNLPFYLTSPVIRKFLEDENPPQEMVFFVQKEVAQRICSQVPYMNLLAVSVRFYAESKIIGYVSKKSFWPRPKVDSAILQILPLAERPAGADLFFRIVKAGFSQPRKQLINNLAGKLKSDKEKIASWLTKNGVQPSQRAETLGIEDWMRLARSFPF